MRTLSALGMHARSQIQRIFQMDTEIGLTGIILTTSAVKKISLRMRV